MMLTTGAVGRIMQVQNRDLITTSVGQGVGLIDAPRSARHVVARLVEEFIEAAISRVGSLVQAP
jgi:hypothetical protein